MNNIILSLITRTCTSVFFVVNVERLSYKLFDIWEVELELGTPPLGARGEYESSEKDFF